MKKPISLILAYLFFASLLPWNVSPAFAVRAKFDDLITGGPWVDVRKYGADNTGVTSSKTAVQDAMNSGANNVFFPPGTYIGIDNITVPEGVKRIFGLTATGTVLKGSASGNMFIMNAFDSVEIDHLHFTGTNSTAIYSVNSITRAHIHNNIFDRSLSDCISGPLILSIIEWNTFGYVANDTLGSSHRHIYSVGDESKRVNANYVKFNRFFLATGSYSTVFDGGSLVTFEGNEWESNHVIPVSIKGMESAVFNDNWFENNEGLYEIDTEDATSGLTTRFIKLTGNTFVPHDNITHLINLAGSVIPSIYFTHNIASAMTGNYITKSASGNDYYLAEYVGNVTINYSRNNFDTTYPLTDTFFASRTFGATDVTGDGTSYVMQYDSVSESGGSAYSDNTHTATTTGLYAYNIGMILTGIDNTHTMLFINLVTTGKTYSYRANPYLSLVDGYVELRFTVNTYMNAGNTAYVTVSVIGGNKTVDFAAGNANTFSGGRIR